MKNKFIYILALFAIITTVSCSNWLDVKPKTRLDREEIFSNELGFKDALVGCYIKLKARNLYGSKLTITTVEFLAQNWAVDNTTSTEYYLSSFDYKATAVADNFKAIYGDIYNILVQVNDILNYMEKRKHVFENPDTYNNIKGEALALRAFLHFDILRIFGQLPQGGTVKVSLPYLDKVSIVTPSYINYSQFVGNIEADLNAAEQLLKDSDPVLYYHISALNDPAYLDPRLKDDFFGARRFRLNYYAVKAIQARFHLYTGNVAKANSAAMTVINAKAEKDQKPQFIFDAMNSFSQFNYALPNENIFCLNDITLNKYAFDNFKKTVSVANDKQKIIDIYDGEYTTNNRFNGFWKDVTAGVYQYFTIKKYDQLDSDIGTGTEVRQTFDRQLIPIIRLSEMYLIAMETMNYTEAQPLYDIYRRDRNLQSKQFTDNDYKLQEIIKEYRREFIGEGVMFYTYKRLNSTTMLWRNYPIVENNYIVPLPDTEYNPNN